MTYLINRLAYYWQQSKPVLLWPWHALCAFVKVALIVCIGIAFVLYLLFQDRKR